MIVSPSDTLMTLPEGVRNFACAVKLDSSGAIVIVINSVVFFNVFIAVVFCI